MSVVSILVPVITFLVFIAGLVWVWYQQKAYEPPFIIYDIGVKFLNGADPMMVGIPETCAAISDVIRSEFPSVANEFISHLILEFHGRDAIIKSSSIPTGEIIKADGTSAVIMGTCDVDRVTLFSPKTYVAKARQAAPTETFIRSAGKTAIFHEVAEHLLPFVAAGNWNHEHLVRWTLITHLLQDSYQRQFAIQEIVTGPITEL